MGLPEEFIERIKRRSVEKRKEYQEPWPEHLLVKSIFDRLSTQWNVEIGMCGAVYLGINYSSLEFLFRVFRIPHKQRPELLDDIQIMEFSARKALDEKR